MCEQRQSAHGILPSKTGSALKACLHGMFLLSSNTSKMPGTFLDRRNLEFCNSALKKHSSGDLPDCLTEKSDSCKQICLRRLTYFCPALQNAQALFMMLQEGKGRMQAMHLVLLGKSRQPQLQQWSPASGDGGTWLLFGQLNE